jgi:long-chain acyl-CoA synthetase
VNFLENILHRLEKSPGRVVLEELRPEGCKSATAGELLSAIAAARAFLSRAGLGRGDRCALLAPNSIAWAALDLAAMAEGIIVVPLYARQTPAELAIMIRDSQPKLICCGDAALRDAVRQAWPEGPGGVLLEDVINAGPPPGETILPVPSVALAGNDLVAIIYTSGTSGEPKGVVLTVDNVTHMISCTTARLDLLMGTRSQPDQVFHYLPFCFAGSWILLLSCLSRESVLRLSTDLTRVGDDMALAAPDYFLNVPAMLDRVRAVVEGRIAARGGIAEKIFHNARASWVRRQTGADKAGALWLALGRALIFPAIRKGLGPNLKALICGSAPLAIETQYFFLMLGIPVLQVYGLTETTAICTMDHPQHDEPGAVGRAIPGIEMKLSEGNEILVRGPNVFPGYWKRPEATAKALAGGWFHTGDLGEQTPAGNWRITGRLKDLLILSSGHNIAPEPIENHLMRVIPGARQVILFGHGRSYLTAMVTGDVQRDNVEKAMASVNADAQHYRRIRAFHIEPRPLTNESGLLTVMGKLRRDAIAAQYHEIIEGLYTRNTA